MEFLLSAEEDEVISLAREALLSRTPVARLREEGEWSGWTSLAADGWLHAALSDELSLGTLAGIAREAGRVAGVHQFVSNAWTIPALISSAADGASRDAWLTHQAARPGAVLRHDQLDQDRPVVPGLGAGYDLYFSPAGAGTPELHRVEHDQIQHESVGELSFGVRRVISRSTSDQALPLTLSVERRAQIGQVARVLTAAGATGLAAELVAGAVAHVADREQFGQPLGRFQAVKHMLADAHTAAEVAWLAVLFAAAGSEVVPAEADSAVLLADRAVVTAAQTSSQLQGAMGFTWESDLHLFLKAALDSRVCGEDLSGVAHRAGRAFAQVTED